MLEFVRGDIFATKEITHVVHGVNLQGAFGAGIAGEIAVKFPEVRRDYQKWLDTHTPDLGEFHETKATSRRPAIIHGATQKLPGRTAELWAVEKVLDNVAQFYGWRKHVVLAIPQIGCGIGGLYWPDVKAIIERLFMNARATVLVFQFFVSNRPAEIRGAPVHVLAPARLKKDDKHKWVTEAGGHYSIMRCGKCGLFRYDTSIVEGTKSLPALNAAHGNYPVKMYSRDKARWFEERPNCLSGDPLVELVAKSSEIVTHLAYKHEPPYDCVECGGVDKHTTTCKTGQFLKDVGPLLKDAGKENA